jgi:hypothetical protein
MSREAVAHLQKVLGTSGCCSLVAIPAEADFQPPQAPQALQKSSPSLAIMHLTRRKEKQNGEEYEGGCSS